jgi:hypothetical protein
MGPLGLEYLMRATIRVSPDMTRPLNKIAIRRREWRNPLSYFLVADQFFNASSVFSTCFVGLRLMY